MLERILGIARRNGLKRLCCLLPIFLLLTACGGTDKKVTKFERAVKIFKVKAGSDQRKLNLSGVVSSAHLSDLSFEVPGRIEMIKDKKGLIVKKGTILASLDKLPYILKLKSAEAELARAEAIFFELKQRYIANKKLYEKKHVSRLDFRKAEANYKVGISNVELAKAKLKAAQINLKKTDIRAPFDGQLIETFAKKFSDVTAGQIIIKFHSLEKYEVTINVPDVFIDAIKIGIKVDVIFVTMKNLKVTGHVSEISGTTNEANVYPVVISLDQLPKNVRSGMIVEVIFSFKGRGLSHLVPLTAVLPGNKMPSTYVFIYNKKDSRVYKRQVVATNVNNNMAVIKSGLKEGDWVVTTGIRFLLDGQKVRLLKVENQ